jgi:hypothetical protein
VNNQIDIREQLIDNESIADMKYVFARAKGFGLLIQILRDLLQMVNNDQISRIIIFILGLFREFVSESSKSSTSEDVVAVFYKLVAFIS